MLRDLFILARRCQLTNYPTYYAQKPLNSFRLPRRRSRKKTRSMNVCRAIIPQIYTSGHEATGEVLGVQCGALKKRDSPPKRDVKSAQIIVRGVPVLG